jgi:putative endonuclease
VSHSARQRAGEAAEALAARHLAAQGLRIVARNHRVRGAEIDLIARDGAVLVFIEVRMRREGALEGAHGGALASIDRRKQARVALAAQHYLARFDPAPPARFDVLLLDNGDPPQIAWLKDAFSL